MAIRQRQALAAAATVVLLFLSAADVNAQFGTPKRKRQQTVQIDANGEVRDSAAAAAAAASDDANTKRPVVAKITTESETGVPTLDETHVPRSEIEEEILGMADKAQDDDDLTIEEDDDDDDDDDGITVLKKWSHDWIVKKLRDTDSELELDMAKSIAAVIISVQKQDDHSITKQQALPTARQFAKDMTEEEIVKNLAKGVGSLKYVEAMFLTAEDYPEHKDEPYKQLKEANMIPAGREEEFEKDPEALKDHMRKTAYFSFISLAVAGGYMPESSSSDGATKKHGTAAKKPTASGTQQTGDPPTSSNAQEGTATADVKVLEKLRKVAPDMDEQIIKDIAAVVYSAQHNEKQRELRVKASERAPQFRSEVNSDPEKILDHLVKALEGLKRIDELFANGINHHQILDQMITAGVIADDQTDEFADDPVKLKDHVRSTAYFTFIALAIAGEYMTVDVED